MILGPIVLVVILIVLVVALGAALTPIRPLPPNWGPELEDIEKYGWEEALRRYENEHKY